MNYEDMMKAAMLHPVAVDPRDGYHTMAKIRGWSRGVRWMYPVLLAVYTSAHCLTALYSRMFTSTRMVAYLGAVRMAVTSLTISNWTFVQSPTTLRCSV